MRRTCALFAAALLLAACAGTPRPPPNPHIVWLEPQAMAFAAAFAQASACPKNDAECIVPHLSRGCGELESMTEYASRLFGSLDTTAVGLGVAHGYCTGIVEAAQKDEWASANLWTRLLNFKLDRELPAFRAKLLSSAYRETPLPPERSGEDAE